MLSEQIVSVLKSVLTDKKEFVPLHEPIFRGNEWLYVKDCLDTTFVSSVGKFVDRFEKDLAQFTGAEYAIAVVNGTAALQIALKLAGIKTNDEVLIPALTFIATANSVSYLGALPHFVDSEEYTLGMSPLALRDHLNSIAEIRSGNCINKKTGNRIGAIVPMHTFGHPVDLDGILSVAKDFHLIVIEDAAESLGSYYHGKHTGTFGLLGTLSFNGNKTITTGGGGAILTNDKNLATLAKHITTTAKIPHPWEYTHDMIGYNFRLPNINAALGCAQLELLPEFLSSKRRLYNRYKNAFSILKEVKIQSEPSGCKSNYWLQTLVLDPSVMDAKDSVLTDTNASGLMTRPAWTLLHKLKPYQDCFRMELPVAESLERRLINIPSSANLNNE
ncbi:aminotransferase, LLPSF_NHT_00031 family [Leptospira weilii serovar Ranarum str. ICFT]|uniref:GDP-perosamine synthase n=1 Tax=Leptospira weilii serovar Ranarum str. ICFT TaxID=1218598 RepID=N1W7S2_9LEPT|nr:LegC family aminotransferase [Leptospira weilii]EMY76276.1 aminotransferase, LLPSF_NHT_00031 family [Leptospira weilii serovar Ranarum str. ICFT]